MPKPFIAARIPEALNKALEKHTNKKGGESRTDAVINALNAYLGQPLGLVEGSPEIDRIAELERRVSALENNTGRAVQGNLLDKDSVINPDKETKNDIENRISGTSDKNTDNNLLTHKQISDLTGTNINSVRSKYRNDRKISKDDKTYTPIKIKNKPRWRIDNISD